MRLSKYTLFYPLFRATIFFTFQAQSCLASFSISVVSSLKQPAVVFTPALLLLPIFYPLPKGPIFLDPITLIRSLLYLLYIKHHFHLNIQFSIDSFLDWEGLHWDFSSTITSPPVSVPYRIHSDAEATNVLRY